MKSNKFILIYSFILFSLFILASCNKQEPEPEKEYLKLGTTELFLERSSFTTTVTVETNVNSPIVTVSPGTWCTATYANGILTVDVKANSSQSKRATHITVRGEKVSRNISVNQEGRAVIPPLAAEVKIPVKSATASSAQGGEGIDKSYDGDYKTIYHSAYSGNNLPVTLTYEFDNASQITHFNYYPRSSTSGSNGNFKEVEIYYATKENPSLTLYKMHDFKGNSSPARIVFDTPLVNPTKIQFKILSGMGGYASCAEMEFYKKNDEAFDYLTIFTDPSCSEIKAGITEAQINAIPEDFFRMLASEIYNGDYADEFRIQTYDSYLHPDVSAAINKTSTYGLRDNITGIYANKAGDEIIFFAGDTHGQSISVAIQDPDGGIKAQDYPVVPGLNRFKAPYAGLMYIIYYYQSATGAEKPVKINFVTGEINGYFDNSKHTKDDWNRILGEATFRHFDMKGKHATMTFERAAYTELVPDGLALIDLYDKLVTEEQEFMGLKKYGKQYPNRAHFQVVYGDAFMFASSYHTGYNAYTQSTVLNVADLTNRNTYTEAAWGPAHELGHTHQTRPGLKWVGMAEVTNNIHSALIQTSWTGQCRLQVESMASEGGYLNRYEKAFAEIIDKGIPHGEHTDPFCKLVPFWQLKLYVHDVLRKKDFYPDIYEMVRTNPDLGDGESQLKFTEFACDAANLDLIDFFTQWGFYTPVDIIIDDYGKSRLLVTQEMVDATKQRIRAKGYAKPNMNFTRITDLTVGNYH